MPAALQLVRALTRHVDATLIELWTAAQMPPGAALLAVGGYGRGELFPHSDVDVLVLLPTGHAPDDALRASIERFITACWDIGLEIGSSVRTVDECVAEAQRDVTVQTALLESALHHRLAAACSAPFARPTRRPWTPSAFLRAKTLEMRQRHVKYEDTPYALEPNCKESPGGLRDLQVVIWVARAAGLGRTWTELAAKGLITPFEVHQLQRNEGAAQADPRAAARHRRPARGPAGVRPADRGGRELRLPLDTRAARIGSADAALLLGGQGGDAAEPDPDAEHRGARQRRRGRSRCGRSTSASSIAAGMLEVASDDLYVREPHAILETFLVYQQTPGIKGLSARTLRALYNARNLMDAKFRRDPVNRAHVHGDPAPAAKARRMRSG